MQFVFAVSEDFRSQNGIEIDQPFCGIGSRCLYSEGFNIAAYGQNNFGDLWERIFTPEILNLRADKLASPVCRVALSIYDPACRRETWKTSLDGVDCFMSVSSLARSARVDGDLITLRHRNCLTHEVVGVASIDSSSIVVYSKVQYVLATTLRWPDITENWCCANTRVWKS
jgi:hypothetical protein